MDQTELEYYPVLGFGIMGTEIHVSIILLQ
jgi:hypothetical protein